MDKLTQLQDEALELIKNKKGYKHMKAIKEPKVYTLKQIIKTVIISLTLLSAGAYLGITVQSAINSHIDSQVTEQVKSFTAVE